LAELLKRGHEIDFYSKSSFVYPIEFLGHPNFRYLDHEQPNVDRYARSAQNPVVKHLAGRVAVKVFAARVAAHMRDVDAGRRYNVLLSLGQWALGRVPGLPAVSWVQGAPGSDSRSVVRHRDRIVELCGRRDYAQLRAYSLYRASLGRPPFKHTDVAVCGSRWSERMLVSMYRLPRATTRSLPYPVDLDMFCPGPPRPASGAHELLWVGRVVPRKRLDLFLDAGAALIAQGRDVTLTVVGGFPFAKGFRQLLDQFAYPSRLTYLPHLPREAVRTLLQAGSVLVQPSEEEDFGSSVAEALACGTPVVVGPTNGTGDYIDDGGARFASYAAPEVADAIGRILDSVVAAPGETARRARSAALAHFSVGHVVDGLEAALDQASRVERSVLP
jgi:glycosyltransferase involved in cell wall biosynthesis